VTYGSGPMVRRPDGSLVRWFGDLMVRWPDDSLTCLETALAGRDPMDGPAFYSFRSDYPKKATEKEFNSLFLLFPVFYSVYSYFCQK